MNISEELLKKYALNACSPEEKACVENWLNINNYSDDELQYVSEFHLSRNKVLKKVFEVIDDESPKTNFTRSTPSSHVYQLISKIAVAASLALVFFLAGMFSQNPFKEEHHAKLIKTDEAQQEPLLHISTLNGKPQKVIAEKYDITFEGLIRIFNEAQTEQTIICNGTEIALQSNKAIYLISAPNKGVYELNNALAFDHFSGDGLPSKYYKICLKG